MTKIWHVGEHTRLFDRVRYKLSMVATTKKEAQSQADYWRGKGVLVRVVKGSRKPTRWGLYTLYTR